MIKKLKMNFFKEIISMVGGIVGLVFCFMGAIMICFDYTLGIYLMYRSCKKY